MSEPPKAVGADATVTSQALHGDILRVRQLRVVFGPAVRKGTTATLLGDPVIIGRQGHVDGPLALADEEASRRHASVEHDPVADCWMVADLGSRNGTFVDGQRIHEPTQLADGSVIRAGKTLLLCVDVELRRDEVLVPAGKRIFGNSLAMHRMRAEIARVASKDVPVLILGETGVGKELVAEELHAQSGRSGAFVPVNCAALPAALVESELFGHAAGSFTGARGKAGGLFQAAGAGTLFLDEIGEMPLDIQPKILRALAKREVRPVGATEVVHVDVRFVAATNRDLGAEAAKETFRRDLFARLSGFTIRVPPLRARRDDILPLAELFLGVRGARPLSVIAAEALLLHEWPYNVRELEQAMSVAALNAEGASEVTLDHLPGEIATARRASVVARLASAADTSASEDALAPGDAGLSREMFQELLERFGGNIARVALYLGKDRTHIYRLLKRYALDLSMFRKD